MKKRSKAKRENSGKYSKNGISLKNFPLKMELCIGMSWLLKNVGKKQIV